MKVNKQNIIEFVGFVKESVKNRAQQILLTSKDLNVYTEVIRKILDYKLNIQVSIK